MDNGKLPMANEDVVSSVEIAPKNFFKVLGEQKIGPFVGVPCSLIKSLIAYAADHEEEVDFLNPVHESHAMAIAAGAYLGSGKKELPMVFMQNSGFGNIVNPLTSLHQMYDIPAILLVTWRSEDGYGTDAPEHWIVGENMEQYFSTFQLPYRIMTPKTWKEDIRAMKEEAFNTGKPTVLCVKKGLFEKYAPSVEPGIQYEMTSVEALAMIKSSLSGSIFLSTTGMLSRESFTAEDTPDFYMMGSMGLISGIAAGCAKHTDKKVVAIDGDGAVMMHMGLIPYIGNQGYRNLIHIVIDNEGYSSTGSQPTVSPSVDFAKVAEACGYAYALTVDSKETLAESLEKISETEGPILLCIKVKSGNDHGIGRVSDKYSCPEVSDRFSSNFS